MPHPTPVSAAPRGPSHAHSHSASSICASPVSTPRSTSPPPTFVMSTCSVLPPPAPPSSSSSSSSFSSSPALPRSSVSMSPLWLASSTPFPAEWICSTCGRAHSVLELLTRSVACACGMPALQAVYDQTGCLYLYWRDDPDVYDLRAPAKADEAAWRCWRAGGCVSWGMDERDFKRASSL